jgi:cbb3-type cytochrome oxidase subunit 3
VFADFLRASGWLGLAEWGSLFLAVLFTAIVAWLLASRGGSFQAASRLPLEDDTRPVLPPATAATSAASASSDRSEKTP